MTANHWAWTDEKRTRLIELAASGMIASDIGAAIGTTQASILTYCGRHGIAVVKYSREQQAIYDQRARERELKRNARKVAANRERKIAERAVAMARGDVKAVTVAAPQVNKTSVAYRRQLGSIGEMTKNELRAMLAQAARNTAEMSI